ncbi:MULTISPECIES: uracil-DNA glycosylase [unclassified Pseudactinotalea]|uniref:uracil-DNA glycosylase n=1 Tax=unclassified Pseudactinotalea TaxID=2649176 RepID=UPI00128E92EE|nr:MULTISPECIES: uracil-DNA glycosylase [unclassified Pseudactinotalea]MPV48708.1 uracil-DNA glycosylase [Pseudactinotalea sp. HY160]QGH68673.1 uracil-DNA glycosylase [Pseudactinotalea sp. HY158]
MEIDFHDAVNRGFVPPGSGWPGDLAGPRTPVAANARDVADLSELSALAGGARERVDDEAARAGDSAADAASLDELSARISVCRACPRLVDWREEVARTRRRAFRDQTYWGRPAPGFGDPRATFVILGLAPAAHGANRTGRVFTGDRTGDWLVEALYRAGYANQPTSTHAGDGLELTGVRMLSSVRCAPPQNKPTTEEVHTCAPWLDAELRLLRPTVLLALGGIAWQSAATALVRLGWQLPRPRPRFGHGQVMSAHPAEPARPAGDRATAGPGPTGERAGAWAPRLRVVGCYHPSQQNTFTGRLTEEMFDAALELCREHPAT